MLKFIGSVDQSKTHEGFWKNILIFNILKNCSASDNGGERGGGERGGG